MILRKFIVFTKICTWQISRMILAILNKTCRLKKRKIYYYRINCRSSKKKWRAPRKPSKIIEKLLQTCKKLPFRELCAQIGLQAQYLGWVAAALWAWEEIIKKLRLKFRGQICEVEKAPMMEFLWIRNKQQGLDREMLTEIKKLPTF